MKLGKHVLPEVLNQTKKLKKVFIGTLIAASHCQDSSIFSPMLQETATPQIHLLMDLLNIQLNPAVEDVKGSIN